jgi:hypothetical protein
MKRGLEEGLEMTTNQEREDLLLAQHRQLRPLLIALDKEAGEVLSATGDDGGLELQILREGIESVRRELERHFASEESFFESLAGIHEWWPLRLEFLKTAHRHQRKLLDALCANPPLLAPHSLARVAAALAGEVLAGMVDEETDLEAAGLIEDDALDCEVCDDDASLVAD